MEVEEAECHRLPFQQWELWPREMRLALSTTRTVVNATLATTATCSDMEMQTITAFVPLIR